MSEPLLSAFTVQCIYSSVQLVETLFEATRRDEYSYCGTAQYVSLHVMEPLATLDMRPNTPERCPAARNSLHSVQLVFTVAFTPLEHHINIISG